MAAFATPPTSVDLMLPLRFPEGDLDPQTFIAGFESLIAIMDEIRQDRAGFSLANFALVPY